MSASAECRCHVLHGMRVDFVLVDQSLPVELFYRDGKTLLIGYQLVHGGVCVIPETVTSIGYGAFDCCTSLKEMRIHASVTDIEENAFDDCGFVYFTVNRRNQYYYSTRYGELIKY